MGAAVETGTFLGDTTAFLAERCPRVITIEVDPDLAARGGHDSSTNRASGCSRVTAVHCWADCCMTSTSLRCSGSTATSLGPHEGVQTARGRTDTPLLEELKALADWKHVKDSVVLIDDARLIGVGDYPSFDEIREVVRAFGDQSVSIECDAVVIQPFRILPRGLA